MNQRKLYSPDDDNAGGGGDDPKKKDTPPKYKPVPSTKRKEWNDYLDYLQKEGIGGSKDLDDPAKNMGASSLEKYKKENPHVSLTKEDIPNIQYEQQQFRKGESFPGATPEQTKVLRSQVNPKYFERPISEPGQPFNSALSREYYPQFKKGDKQYGTDIEGFLKDYYHPDNNKPPEKATSNTDGKTGSPPEVDSAKLKEKYKDNPYLSEQGRYNWGSKLSKDFPLTGDNVKEAVLNAAKLNNVDPALLYSSAMEEGMSGSVDEKASERASANYVDWSEKNKDKAQDYPVDGFYNYGLDQFAKQAPELEKKGYLPKGFSKSFTEFPAENEKHEKITGAAFDTDANALIAKSAMLRQSKDQLEGYLKKENIKLSDKQKDFFTLSAYNYGDEGVKKMIKSYEEKGYLKDDKFLDTHFKPASYEGVYKNVQSRLQSAKQLKDEKYLD